MTAVEQSARDGDARAPGWYPDPLGRFEQRYFDGSSWTAQVASAGAQILDPLGVADRPDAATAPVVQPAPAPVTAAIPVATAPLATAACMLCRRGPAVPVTFHQGIGMLFLHKHKYVKGPMCQTCGLQAYKALQAKTLATGWWSFLSIFVNPIYLVLNAVNASKVKKLPAPQ